MSLRSRIEVPIPKDNDGYIGRECPIAECEGYFKIKPGTGLKGKDLPCHCAYCGHTAPHNKFATKDQIAFVRSFVHRTVVDDLRDEFKKFEFDIRPKGPFGIGISMKLKPGTPIPLKRYRERTLETHVCCSNCTLDYSVYGVFPSVRTAAVIIHSRFFERMSTWFASSCRSPNRRLIMN